MSQSRRLSGPLSFGLSKAIARPEGVGGMLNALSPSKAALAADSADLNWLVIGDSTSASDARLVKSFLTWLAPFFPKYTVVYAPPDGSGGYSSPVTIQTGTGTHTFTVYNNSVSGTLLSYLMASKFTAACVTPGKTWDLIWLNHGKNFVVGSTQPITEGIMLAGIAQLQLSFPAANMLVTDQYPNRDDSNMDLASTSWADVVANAPQISKLNLKSGTTYVGGDYTDNAHLTDAAYLAKIDPLVQALWTGTKSGAWSPETPWLTIPATNLLNGDANEAYCDFGANGNGTVPGAANVVPSGLTNSGTINYSQEGTIKYGANARSQKLQGSGAAATFMRRASTATKLALAKGNRVILTVMEYIDPASAATVGRVGVSMNGTGAASTTSTAASQATGGWKVSCIGPLLIPSDATFLQTTLYHDTAAPDATHADYFQWATLTTAPLPRASA